MRSIPTARAPRLIAAGLVAASLVPGVAARAQPTYPDHAGTARIEHQQADHAAQDASRDAAHARGDAAAGDSHGAADANRRAHMNADDARSHDAESHRSGADRH